jgi:serine/threonine protein kinase/lipoprotein NlpI
MRPDNWQRTEELFHEALSRSPEERAGYLAQACANDATLYAEVESLLAAFENRQSMIERRAFSLGMQVLSQELSEDSLVGKQIGPYKIQRLLGRGGMGEVYLAQNDLLDLKVALKFLSYKFTDDAWARRQLIKEAQAIVRMDHQNICKVYGFEEHAGYIFLDMQYIEGETLASLIRQGRLEAERVLRLATQLARALVNAHSHGIVHRDIKPQNIMVTVSGQVKVLDFGLAKLIQQKSDATGDGESDSSQQGLVLGTVAYMSPEQLKAERLDFRSDIFSFGIVLYEMISGRNPYSKASNAETITAILTSEPEPLARPISDMQTGLAVIAQKCLRKDREKRYQSAIELLLDLDHPDKKVTDPSRRPAYLSLTTYALLALLLMIVIGTLFMHFRPAQVQSLAILPIVYQGDDADSVHLSEGLTESLINKLSGISALQVKPLSMVSHYKDQQFNSVQIGRELQVDLVLSSAIIQEQGSLILQSTLIRMGDGLSIWQRAYPVEPDKILELLNTLSGQVASKSQVPLSKEERKSLAMHQTENPDAFKLYFRGRHYWRMRDKENIQQAIACFEQAINLDLTYAQAYAGLADCYLILSSVAYGPLSTPESMSKARYLAEKALELDDTLCDAHTSLGVYQLRYGWNWAEAEYEFQQALKLNPNYAQAYYWYSNLLALMGRTDEAIAAGEKAKALDPFSPLAEMNLARVYHYARQEEVAAELFRKMIDKDPKDPYNLRPSYMLGYVYERQGRYQDSIQCLQKVYQKDPLWAAAPLGYVYAITGRRVEAKRILAELEDQTKHPLVPPQERAIIYLGLGDKDQAFRLLQEACNDRFASLPVLLIEPFLDPLRADPRFIELARCVKLAR